MRFYFGKIHSSENVLILPRFKIPSHPKNFYPILPDKLFSWGLKMAQDLLSAKCLGSPIIYTSCDSVFEVVSYVFDVAWFLYFLRFCLRLLDFGSENYRAHFLKIYAS